MAFTPQRLIILGASGGCVDLLSIALAINKADKCERFKCVGFLDDREDLKGKSVLGLPVFGGFTNANKYAEDHYFVTGIGSSENFWERGKIIQRLGIPASRFATLIHPMASISPHTYIGSGCTLFPFAAVMTNAELGNGVVIQPQSTVNHDTKIGDYTIVTTGVSLSSSVNVKHSCYLGSNAVIRQNLTIGEQSLIGMGSVVTKSIAPRSVVYGNPAHFIRKLKTY